MQARSTSYPTLGVIDEFEITDPEEQRLIWQWAGIMADYIWERAKTTSRDFSDQLLAKLRATFPRERMHAIQHRLNENLEAAHKWCLDNME